MAVVALRTEAKRRRRVDLRRATPYFLITPTLVVIAGILAVPLGVLVTLSFQKYGLAELFAHQGKFVGLDNFATILADALFWQVVRTSVIFAIANVGLTILLGTLVALLLQRVHLAVRTLLTAGLVFVWATPALVSIDVWQWMFDFEFGVANYALTQLGVGDFIHHNWFENPLEGFAVITGTVVWGAIPFVAITLYAGLMQVPRELVEAAQVDGAGPFAVFRNVTAPILRPLFLILASLSTIWDFSIFQQVWVMLNQRPSQDFYLMGVYAYVESFKVSQYGLGSAIAVVMVGILVIVTFFYVREMVRTRSDL
jgi:N,N'-diacetylchitobiose transport system permease protein